LGPLAMFDIERVSL